MKIKLPIKKKKEEGPKKGFEEFAIDPKVLDELDSLEDTPIDTNETTSEESQVETSENSEEIPSLEEEKIEVLDEPKKQEIKNQVIDASSIDFINIVRENVDFCANEIKDISATMDKIEAQKNSESFWKKGENIKIISKYVSKMSDVQQKTLDLLVMFLGASGKMADDYDTILKTIDELGELNGGETEVLNYLLKVKKMIKEIKNNDERLKAIIYDNELLKEQLSQIENNYKDKVDSFERNSKIYLSKINRLNARLNRQSFFLLLAYILIATLGIIIYLKVFK